MDPTPTSALPTFPLRIEDFSLHDDPNASYVTEIVIHTFEFVAGGKSLAAGVVHLAGERDGFVWLCEIFTTEKAYEISCTKVFVGNSVVNEAANKAICKEVYLHCLNPRPFTSLCHPELRFWVAFYFV